MAIRDIPTESAVKFIVKDSMIVRESAMAPAFFAHYSRPRDRAFDIGQLELSKIAHYCLTMMKNFGQIGTNVLVL